MPTVFGRDRLWAELRLRAGMGKLGFANRSILACCGASVDGAPHSNTTCCFVWLCTFRDAQRFVGPSFQGPPLRAPRFKGGALNVPLHQEKDSAIQRNTTYTH